MLNKFIPLVKEKLKFSKKEYLDIILASLILSFIFSLSRWEGQLSYMTHLIVIIILVFCTLIIHLAIQKAFGMFYGYSSEFKISIISLLTAVMIAFLTEVPTKDILLVLVIPGTLVYKAMPKFRIGKWPKGPNFGEMSFITSSGIILNLVLAVFFYGLYLISGLWGFWLITIINVFFAFGTVLPLPLNDGLILLYGSRIGYIITATFIVISSYLIFMQSSFLTVLLLAIIVMLTVWANYYYFVERKV